MPKADGYEHAYEQIEVIPENNSNRSDRDFEASNGCGSSSASFSEGGDNDDDEDKR